MKKFVLACLLSLPLVALSHQEAKAWFKVCCGGSFNFSIQSGGHKFCCWSEPTPQCCDAPACNGYVWGNEGYGYGYAAAPIPPAVQAPIAQAAWNPGYYGSAAGYGYYPSYWYGR